MESRRVNVLTYIFSVVCAEGLRLTGEVLEKGVIPCDEYDIKVESKETEINHPEEPFSNPERRVVPIFGSLLASCNTSLDVRGQRGS